MAFNSVRMHKNSAHIHVIAAQAVFNNHQNGVGSDLLYQTQAAKCIMCIVHEKSKHNRYRSTTRQMKTALEHKIVSTDYNKMFKMSYVVLPAERVQCEYDYDEFFTGHRAQLL